MCELYNINGELCNGYPAKLAQLCDQPQFLYMKYANTTLLTLAAIFSTICMYGQARDGSVMIDNANRNAEMISINQPVKVAVDALQQRMERSGLKEKGKDNVWSYKGVVLSEISPDKIDIYTKVEQGPNNTSIVYMAVSRGYNNFTNSGADSVITQNIKTFLESFIKKCRRTFRRRGDQQPDQRHQQG